MPRIYKVTTYKNPQFPTSKRCIVRVTTPDQIADFSGFGGPDFNINKTKTHVYFMDVKDRSELYFQSENLFIMQIQRRMPDKHETEGLYQVDIFQVDPELSIRWVGNGNLDNPHYAEHIPEDAALARLEREEQYFNEFGRKADAPPLENPNACPVLDAVGAEITRLRQDKSISLFAKSSAEIADLIEAARQRTFDNHDGAAITLTYEMYSTSYDGKPSLRSVLYSKHSHIAGGPSSAFLQAEAAMSKCPIQRAVRQELARLEYLGANEKLDAATAAYERRDPHYHNTVGTFDRRMYEYRGSYGESASLKEVFAQRRRPGLFGGPAKADQNVEKAFAEQAALRNR
ncbi:MAG: hypothetical protein K0U29_03895 [Gammaproteobacteria bacterium]|nr:hypothetical protein [Gammaproteobacteria bacterium]